MNSIKTLGSESLKELSVTSFKESTESLNRLGEKIIQEKARDVAAQIEIYLGSHPKLKREDLSKDPWLKTIAVQKVGETGYTAVHDTQGFNYFHANPKIVGMNLQQLSTKFPAFPCEGSSSPSRSPDARTIFRFVPHTGSPYGEILPAGCRRVIV